jgi:hypothetical protein
MRIDEGLSQLKLLTSSGPLSQMSQRGDSHIIQAVAATLHDCVRILDHDPVEAIADYIKSRGLECELYLRGPVAGSVSSYLPKRIHGHIPSKVGNVILLSNLVRQTLNAMLAIQGVISEGTRNGLPCSSAQQLGRIAGFAFANKSARRLDGRDGISLPPHQLPFPSWPQNLMPTADQRPTL